MAFGNPIASFGTAPKTMCTTQAHLYLVQLTSRMWGTPAAYEQQRQESRGDRHYHIYTVPNPQTGEKEEFYFDITAFFGRGGLIMKPGFRDAPPQGQPLPLAEVLDRDDVDLALAMAKKIDQQMGFDKITKYISSLTLTFKPFASDMLSQYIALHDGLGTIVVAPVRTYRDDVPILHGFKLYRLFIIHQIDHALYGFSRNKTEIPLKEEYYRPIVGEDCLDFEPLPDFNFANDFLNYTFWTHCPGAFLNDYERNAFRTSALYGMNYGLFSRDELIERINASVRDEKIKDTLIAVLGAT